MHHSYLEKHFYLPKSATKYPSEQTQNSRAISSIWVLFFSVLFLPVVYLSAIFTHLMIGKCACASSRLFWIHRYIRGYICGIGARSDLEPIHRGSADQAATPEG